MNEALRSVKDSNKIRQSRNIEDGKRKRIESELKKKRKAEEKEKKKQKDKDENKLTRFQSVVKNVREKKNKLVYGNFEEKYISLLGSNVSDTTKYGTVWQQIHKVREDDYNEIEKEVIINKLEKAGAKVEETDDSGGEVKRILPKQSAIDDESIKHIENGEITYKSYIIIPYSNAYEVYELLKENKLKENVTLKDDKIKNFEEGNYILLEQTENDLTYYCYYIPVIIKARIRFARIMKKIEKENIDKEKKAIIAKNNKERDDIMENFDAIMNSVKANDDILHDNVLLSVPPYKKISHAYCYIHPINVILYDKTIEYGLIWRKNNNVIDNDDYVDISDFFDEKKDTNAFEIFKKNFESKYSEDSEDKDLIDLSECEEIVKLTKNYDFSQGNLYYKNDETSTYVCEPTKFDYKYKQGSFKEEEYFETHQISGDLMKDKENIEELQKKLNENILNVMGLAQQNIKFNEVNTYNRQFESDAKIEENKNKFLYYWAYVVLSYLKYVQDTIFAGIKTLFSSKWNNVMTGFLILIFIIVLIFVGISAGGEEKNEGPNKKPKEENKDFFAVIKSIPADMNNLYNSAMNFSSDIGNMMSNSRRTINDIAGAITGDDNSEDIDRPSLDDGRGGDNFIHFGIGDDPVNSKYSMKTVQIVPIINNINYDGSASQLAAIYDTIKLGVKDISVNAGEAQMYVPDCTSNKYFDTNCELIEHDPDSKVKIVKDSDYEQIKITD
jgi:hypothetical protein